VLETISVYQVFKRCTHPQQRNHMQSVTIILKLGSSSSYSLWFSWEVYAHERLAPNDRATPMSDILILYHGMTGHQLETECTRTPHTKITVYLASGGEHNTNDTTKHSILCVGGSSHLLLAEAFITYPKHNKRAGYLSRKMSHTASLQP
jgi:hypothetical protein